MRRLISILLALCLLPAMALADVQILWKNDTATLGGQVEFEVLGAKAASYQYTVLKNGKELFTTQPVAQSFGAYRPLQEGSYTLRVAALDEEGNKETAESAFSITSFPVCHLSCEKESILAGDSVTFLAEVEGGVPPFSYAYSVVSGSERIACQESPEASFQYTFGQAGHMQVQALVTDAQGNPASAALSLSIQEGPGLGISGSTGAFVAQGGMKEWTAHSPGVWTAETDADFIHLSPTCGESGDSLTLLASPGKGVLRQGTVTISCGKISVDFQVTQSAGNGVEEEISLNSARDYLVVEDDIIHSWQNAQGEKRFQVGATGSWTAEGTGDFFSFHQEENTLVVAAQENSANQLRSGQITLSCQSARAYLYIFQFPTPQGADVEEVSLDQAQGTAYQDTLTARVATSLDAHQLVISSAAWSDPLIFGLEHAQAGEDHFLWLIDIPLQGSGSQTLLFAAENKDGANRKKTAEIFVEAERAAFAEESAHLVKDEKNTLLSVQVTAAADSIHVLDASGALIQSFTPENAQIDRCVPGDETGRYAKWTMLLPPDAAPAAVKLGDAALSVTEEAAAPHEFVLYSQSDGWWQDKKYRHSTLEHSGCAIFALSHALQLLGYTGDEILPESLAETYAFCLLEGGTMNSTLIGHAGNDFGFKTRYDLYTNLSDILSRMEKGAVYSFAVVSGHIAMVAGVSEDKTKFRIIDSAPSATFERIRNASIYYQNEAGDFIAISSLDEIPGSTYYIETDSYGGMEYYLDAAYVAKRGVRLILPESK